MDTPLKENCVFIFTFTQDFFLISNSADIGFGIFFKLISFVFLVVEDRSMDVWNGPNHIVLSWQILQRKIFSITEK